MRNVKRENSNDKTVGFLRGMERREQATKKRKRGRKEKESARGKKRRFKEKKNCQSVVNLAVALCPFSFFCPHFQLSSSVAVIKKQRCACNKFILSKGGCKKKYLAKEHIKEPTCPKKRASALVQKAPVRKQNWKNKKIFSLLKSN